MAQALYLSHSASPKGAVSAASPLPATTPWMVSYNLYSGIFIPLNWYNWAICAIDGQVLQLLVIAASLGHLLASLTFHSLDLNKALGLSLSSMHYWPPLCLLRACCHRGPPPFPCYAFDSWELHLQTWKSDFWIRFVQDPHGWMWGTQSSKLSRKAKSVLKIW